MGCGAGHLIRGGQSTRLPHSWAVTSLSGLGREQEPRKPPHAGAPESTGEGSGAELGEMATGHCWEDEDNSEHLGGPRINFPMMQVGKRRAREPDMSRVTRRWLQRGNQPGFRRALEHSVSNAPGVPISGGAWGSEGEGEVSRVGGSAMTRVTILCSGGGGSREQKPVVKSYKEKFQL